EAHPRAPGSCRGARHLPAPSHAQGLDRPLFVEVPAMMMGTVYNCASEIKSGKFSLLPYFAILNEVGDGTSHRRLASSDLDALRGRLKQLGLKRQPPHPNDPSVILEVWL